MHLWVERSTVSVKCLTQEHNTMVPDTSQARTARSSIQYLFGEQETIIYHKLEILQSLFSHLYEIGRI